MSDIVERLRKEDDRLTVHGGVRLGVYTIFHEAADEIERLRADLAAAEMVLDQIG